MVEEDNIFTETSVDTMPIQTAAQTRSFIDKATTVDDAHVPEFIRKNFWAYYNELALTANLKSNDVRSFKFTAEIITYMQMMQFSADELETEYDFTSFLQTIDSVLANLSRTIDAKIYDTAVKSVQEQIITQKEEQLEKKKGVSLL